MYNAYMQLIGDLFPSQWYRYLVRERERRTGAALIRNKNSRSWTSRGGVQKKRNMKINEQTAGGVLSGVKIYRSRTGAMVYKYNNGGVLVVNEAAARAKLYFRSISRRGFDVSKAKCGFKNIPYVLAEI